VEACSKHVRDKRPCIIARKEIHGMVEIKLLCFRWLSPFFKHVWKGFPGFKVGEDGLTFRKKNHIIEHYYNKINLKHHDSAMYKV